MLGKNFKLLTITLLTLLSTATFAAVHTQYSSTVCSNTPYLFDCGPITGNGSYQKTLGDSTVTVNLFFGTLKAVAYSATIEPGQTYLFGCQKLTADATETNTLQQAGCECDSTVTLTLQVQVHPAPPTSVTVTYTANIYDGETYLFGCQKLTVAGPYTETFQRVNGGDSIVNLTLNVNPVPSQDVTVAYTANIFDGETYLFGCQKLTAAGPYTETFQRVNGGDSIVNLTLNVNPAPSQKITVEYNSEIEVDQTYLFGCKKYTFSETGLQTLKDSLPAVNGGDSIIIVHLTVSAGGGAQADTVVGYTATIYTGETYLFSCQKLTTAGVYKDTLQRINVIGDSVTVLTLNVVDPSVTVAYTADINEGQTYLFGCQKLTAAGSYTETFQRVNGGDSIVNLTLNVGCPDAITVAPETHTMCDGDVYMWPGHDAVGPLVASGVYKDTIRYANGCDSAWYQLTLNVQTAAQAPLEDTTICAGEAFTWLGHETLGPLTTSGVYKDTARYTTGCDSIWYQLTLTVLPAAITVDPEMHTMCDGDVYMWPGHDAVGPLTIAGVYKDTIRYANGCDSAWYQLTLIVQTAAQAPLEDTTICAGEAFTWLGHESLGPLTTSGVYKDTARYTTGCDSIWYQLTLTVQDAQAATPEAVTICAGDSYTWVGHESLGYLTEAGVYKDTAYYTTGCDSIWYELTITVQDAQAATPEADSICAGDAYTWVGHEALGQLTEAGTYYDTARYTTGCDSIIYQLDLTVLQHSTGDTTAVECDQFIWYEHTITTTGLYTHTFVNAVGCDSVVTLDATIYYSDSTTMEPVKECNLFRWVDEAQDFDTLITTSGTYTKIFETVHGCDSVVTVDVTISLPYVDTLEVRAYYGYRLIMINRNQINSIWENITLDSLQFDHPEYVTWHEIDLNGNDKVVATGYYYNLPSGDPLPTGYQYYAIVEIPAMPGAECGVLGRTETITIGGAAPAPALVPSLARPGQDIQVINLDPMVETTIRVFTAEGMLQKVYTSSDAESFTIKAADDYGFYLVELISNDMKSTLRYMVK